jgi:hypothetical protein
VNLDDLLTLHSKIAGDVWPDGAVLACLKCGYSVRIDSVQCAWYLANGWPKHCDSQMQTSKGRVDRHQPTPGGTA